MDTELKAKTFYRPLNDDQKCNGNAEVGKVLDSIDTVHGALIAFNDDGDFIGVLSSYKTLYKNHTPPAKKVEHAVIQPMLVTKETPLSDIAKYMAAEKIHLLPVFEDENVIGTISAVDIVKRMYHDENLLLAVSDELRIDRPLMLEMNAKVKDAYSLLRANGVSEIVMMDKQGRVCGAVTRSDIKHAFIHPTDKQRFRHDNFRPDDVSFDAEKKRREDDPVRNYVSALVPTIDSTATNKEIILNLLDTEAQFITVIDKASHPVGIVSYRNILEAISRLTAEDEINIVFEKPSSNVTPVEFDNTVQDLTRFIQKMNKRIPVERAEVRVHEPKFTTRKTVEYDVTLQIDPFTGSQYVSHAKAKFYRQSVHSAIKQIEKQLERSDAMRNKKHHKKSLSEASTEPLKQLFR